MKKLFFSLVLLFVGATALLADTPAPVAYSQKYTIAITTVTPPTVTMYVLDNGTTVTCNGQQYTVDSKTPFQPAGQATITVTTTCKTDPYVHFLFKIKGQKGSSYDFTDYCHVYFDLSSGATHKWTPNPQPEEDSDAFAKGTGVNDPTLHYTIGIGQPTAGGSCIPSTRQPLNPAIVYLVDYNSQTGNMLFRGNLPFTPGLKGQKVDFKGLDTIFKKRFKQIITDGSAFPSSYCLVDIPLIGAEKEGLHQEVKSFNTTVPADGTPTYQLSTPGVQPSGAPDICNAQMLWWPIDPGSAYEPTIKKLGSWIQQNMVLKGNTPTIYYIHCANGHDRTFLAAMSYLYTNYKASNMTADHIYMYATTVYSLPCSPPYNTATYANSLIDPTTSASVPNKSRIYPISQAYTTTATDIIGSVDSKYTANTSGNTGYGLSSFPWNDSSVKKSKISEDNKKNKVSEEVRGGKNI